MRLRLARGQALLLILYLLDFRSLLVVILYLSFLVLGLPCLYYVLFML